jgi:hypothetical protein
LYFSGIDEFEQEAPNYTWMTFQLMKGVWNLNLCDFLDLLQEVGSNSFEFGFGLFRIGLINEFNS